jgi:hypothetical protein
MSGRYMNAGTEYTASTTASGIRDIGNVNGQEYVDGAGTYHYINGFDNQPITGSRSRLTLQR